MKLLRFGPKGREKPGVLDSQGKVRDLSGVIADVTPEVLSPAGLAELQRIDPAQLPIVAAPGRLGVPFAGLGKFMCVDLIHYISQFATLYPGDLISTGTPPGVGMGRSHRSISSLAT